MWLLLLLLLMLMKKQMVMMVMVQANAHYVPGTVQSTCHVLTHFIYSGGGHEIFAKLIN